MATRLGPSEPAVESGIQSLPGGGARDTARRHEPVPGKILRYVDNLIREHDTDKDGKLDEQEWRGVTGNPQAADLDHDGVITSEELTQRIVVYGRHRSLRLAPPATRGGAGFALDSSRGGESERGPASSPVQLDEQTAPAAGVDQLSPLPGAQAVTDSASADVDANRDKQLARNARKFYVPPGRMPAGTAGWFVDRDADGDGQISMREYSAKWTPELTEEFGSYDRNTDGVITAAESVSRAAKAKPAKAVSP